MTQSKVARLSPEKNAGLRRVSPRTTWKSDAPCRKRFMRAMAEVVRFFSCAEELAPERAVIAVVLRDVVNGLQQHAAGAAGGIVNGSRPPGDRGCSPSAARRARGVELARLLVGGVGELLDQVFVGLAEDVRLRRLVAESDAARSAR